MEVSIPLSPDTKTDGIQGKMWTSFPEMFTFSNKIYIFFF